MEYSLEEVARISDEEAVRAAFDRRTIGWLRFLSICFFFVDLGETIGGLSTRNTAGAIAGFVSLGSSIAAFYASRQRSTGRLAAFVRRHARSSAIIYSSTQMACIVAYNSLATAGGHISVQLGNGGAVAWSILVPLLLMGFRMFAPEILLLHALIFAISFPLMGGRQDAPVAAALVTNGIAVSVELLTSRRLRKTTVTDWRERRVNAREQVRMRDELRYAREIQLSMLPDAPPKANWVDVAGISIPANEVGGDYFDYFDVGGNLAIVSGDVAGHGLASGIVLASLRSGFTLLRDSLTDPPAVLQRLHKMIAETSRRRTLVTCAVVLLDRTARTARIASAGHPPILIRRARGGVERIELFAPPLGVRLPLEIPSVAVPFETGDVFILHTDGIYEARDAAGETYGIERLETALQRSDAASAGSLRDAIIADLETFRAGAPQDDDVTVVVAKIV